MRQEFYGRQIAKCLRGCVKAFCGKHGVEEGELSEAVEVPLGTFSNYINGHRGIPVGFLVATCREIQDARPLEKLMDLAFGQEPVFTTTGEAFSSLKCTMEESAECVGRVMLALEDGVITVDEVEECDVAIDAAIEELRKDKRLIRCLASRVEHVRAKTLAEAERLEGSRRQAG